MPPSPLTNYEILDGQVVVPPDASERSGIQPVIATQANGGKRADISAGESETSYQFDRPGTCFPVVRVTSQREGYDKAPFCRICNLDRVRVVVR